MISPVDKKYFKEAVSGPYIESAVDIAAKCPVCGDSKRRNNLKRLHLYERNNVTLVHCFNGDCHLNNQMSLGNFLKFFKPELHFNYRKENFTNNLLINSVVKTEEAINFDFNVSDLVESNSTQNSSVSSNAINVQNSNVLSSADCEQNVNSPGSAINDQNVNQSSNNLISDSDLILSKLSNTEVSTSKIKEYLISRGFNDNSLKTLNYYKALKSFSIDGKFFNIKDFLVIPFFKDNKIYGFYSRSLTEKKFINYSAIPGMNVWNFFNVDLDKPVLIFESIFDAVSFQQLYNFKNVISTNTNSVSQRILNYIKEPVFCFDNDRPGLSKMADFAKSSNYKFLIYPEDLKYKDFNEMLENNVKIDLKFENGIKAYIKLKKLL